MRKKKSFRPTPNSVQNSMKIMTGNKTNSSLRDLGDDEEQDKNIEEKDGVIVSIDKTKINGTGWTVKCNDGTYKCSCASNLYEIPKSKEKSGILYPTEKVRCKIKINPVLRVNTITEIGGSKKSQKKLDINKWTHKDQDTTVIAKTKSAISISDGAITFNYNDNNKITINNDKINLQGNVSINNEPITNITQSTNNIQKEEILMDGNDAISTTTNNINSEITLQYDDFFLLDEERVIGNILDQKQTPKNNQKSILLTDEDIDELNIYNDGIITVKARNLSGKRKIHHTEKWITQEQKNIFETTISGYCDYCVYENNEKAVYIDYCPECKHWNILSKTKNQISCNICGAKFCHACGHNEKNNGKDLKKYHENYISVNGNPCEYCLDILPTNIVKEYVNFCPKCGQWQILNVSSEETNLGVSNQIICESCGEIFCSTCGTQQSGYIQKDFQNKEILYDNYIKKMEKLRFIRED